MALVKVQTRPGIVRERTEFAGSGGWHDSDKVRFRAGYPESIGGWQSLASFQASGVPRSLHEWTSLDGQGHLGVGTNSNYYVLSSNVLYDVTPFDTPISLGNNPLSVTSGSNKIQIAIPDTTIAVGDYITISGATAFGVYTTSDLNIKFIVDSLVGINAVVVISTKTSTSTGSFGGNVVIINPNIPTGNINATYSFGYGIGPYGKGAYGRPSSGSTQLLSVVIRQPRIWSQDNFGQDLIINPRGYGIYIWQAANGASTKAVKLGSVGGAADVPTIANEVFVSTVDQNVFALGCTPFGQTTLDPMYVRWSDQQNPYMWTPLSTNVAGGFRLPSGSIIIGHVQTQNQTLVWTDTSLYSIQYRGGSVVYGYGLLASDVSLLAPKAAVSNGSAVFWIDKGAFFVFNGTVQELPCDIKAYFFSNLNNLQSWKIFTLHNRQYSEVWWFYPSKNSQEVDSYVIYNYKDNVWSIGTMNRTSMIYSSRLKYPIGTDASGYFWIHEYGSDANGQSLNSYIEQSDFDDGTGNNFLLLTEIYPDIEFTGQGDRQMLNIDVLSRDTSGKDKMFLDRIVVSDHTEKQGCRVRGRRLSLRIGSNTVGTGWRLGQMQANLVTSGKR